MKHGMLVVLMALVLCVAGAAWAAEAPTEQAQPESTQVQTQTQDSMTADEWLAAQAEVLPGAIFAGEQCGGVVCGKFLYCCNPSCSICVPYGWSCTQQSCN